MSASLSVKTEKSETKPEEEEEEEEEEEGEGEGEDGATETNQSRPSTTVHHTLPLLSSSPLFPPASLSVYSCPLSLFTIPILPIN